MIRSGRVLNLLLREERRNKKLTCVITLYGDKCRRYHYGECKLRSCYQCGSLDHLIKDCPQPTREDRRTTDTLAPARMFALTETEAKDNKTLSSGKLFL